LIQVSDFNAYAKGRHQGAAVTIGNFDGCHLGHQGLAAQVVEFAERFSLTPLAITFDPRPDAYFRSLNNEALLFTSAQKTRCLGELGIGVQIIQRFDTEFSRVTHEEFLEDYLIGALKTKALIVGDDFRFGHDRLGNLDFLRNRGVETGIKLSIGQASRYQDTRISSSRIRRVIADSGDMDDATVMLGRPYLLEGKIERGDQLGRQLGFPTANLGSCSQLLPKFGVYVGYVRLESSSESDRGPPVTKMPTDLSPAVINIGVRPSVARSVNEIRVEAHILDGNFAPDSLYSLRAGYYIAHRLRDERRFAGLPELQNQISIDIQHAKHWLGY